MTGVPSRLDRPKRPTASDREKGWIFRDLGVEPVINCAGVRTNYGGSNPSADVQAAMAAAADAFVDLDELAEGVGQRLAELTGAEWGVVTAGTAAALALITAASLAGNDPELMLQLPRTMGIPNKVVMPEGHRFAYDSAIRMVGAEIVTAADANSLAASLDGSVVMIVLLGRRDPISCLPLDTIAPVARKRGVPIVVDAAGLLPMRPDPWLIGGADIVIYSCGKYLCGPQSTGLMLGSRALCQAAWANGAPHQAFGRPMKVGKEEIVGAVTALDRWLHSPAPQGQRQAWRNRLGRVNHHLDGLPGVSLEMLPASASVSIDRLKVVWDRTIIPVTSEQLRATLLAGTPRIMIHDFWSRENAIVLDPFNLTDKEADTVGAALENILTTLPNQTSDSKDPSNINASGDWLVSVQFLYGKATHRLELTQDGSAVIGSHRARHSVGTVQGSVEGNRIVLTSAHPKKPMSLFYQFSGVAEVSCLRGTLSVGASTDEHRGPVFMRQFGSGRWRASRQCPGQHDPNGLSAGLHTVP